MEEQFSLDEVVLDEVKEETSNTRPGFLTVLCILTWVGSGFSAISSLFSVLKVSKTTEQLQDAGFKFENLSDELGGNSNTGEPGDVFARNMLEGMGKSIDSVVKWTPTLNWINLGVSLICIFAAILMWKLMKTGYYLYTVATLVAIIAPIALMGSNIITLMSTIIGGVFGMLFVILYGVNLKHMKL